MLLQRLIALQLSVNYLYIASPIVSITYSPLHSSLKLYVCCSAV